MSTGNTPKAINFLMNADIPKAEELLIAARDELLSYECEVAIEGGVYSIWLQQEWHAESTAVKISHLLGLDLPKKEDFK